jgi:RNA polymerase sigma-70 factor (ECF subfamily)
MAQETVRVTVETTPRAPAAGVEGDLIARVARGDRGAFQSLFTRHESYVFWLVRRLAGSAVDAEDVSQEVWLRVYSRARQFSGGEAFRGWLRTIVVRCCLDLRRRRQARGGDRLEEPGGEPPATRPPPALLRLDLERGLAALPEESRQVVVLHDVEGMGHAEIARALGISEEASRSRLSRARRALRERLGGMTR